MSAPQILADPSLVLVSTHGARLGGYRRSDGLAHWSWTRGVWPRGGFEARPAPLAGGIGRLAECFASADAPIDPARWHDTLEELHDAPRLYRITTTDERVAGLLAVDAAGLWWVEYAGPAVAALPGPLWFEPVPDTRHIGAIGRIRLQPRRVAPVGRPVPGDRGALSASRRCRG